MNIHHNSTATQHHGSFHIQKGDSGISSSIQLERRHYVLDRFEGCLLSNPYSCRNETIPVIHSEKDPPVQKLYPLAFLQHPISSQECFALILRWAHQSGIRLHQYLDAWLVITDSLPFLQKLCCPLFQLYQFLGIIINMEKLDLESTQRTQYFGMLVDTIQEKVDPLDSWLTRF